MLVHRYASNKRSSSAKVTSDIDTTREPQDLGWRMPEKKKKGTSEGASPNTGNDREAAAEQRQLAAVRISIISLKSHYLCLGIGKSGALAQRTVRPTETRHSTSLCRARIRDAKGADG